MAAGWDTAVPTFTTLNVDKPAGAGRYYPANYHLSGLTSLAGIMPAFGAWALVVDPAPNDMLVTEILNGINGAALTVTGVAIQIGIGAAGSEVPVVTDHRRPRQQHGPHLAARVGAGRRARVAAHVLSPPASTRAIT